MRFAARPRSDGYGTPFRAFLPSALSRSTVSLSAARLTRVLFSLVQLPEFPLRGGRSRVGPTILNHRFEMPPRREVLPPNLEQLKVEIRPQS